MNMNKLTKMMSTLTTQEIVEVILPVLKDKVERSREYILDDEIDDVAVGDSTLYLYLALKNIAYE